MRQESNYLINCLNPDQVPEGVEGARRGGLRAQRETLVSPLGDAVISEQVYGEPVKEVGAALWRKGGHEVTPTPLYRPGAGETRGTAGA